MTKDAKNVMDAFLPYEKFCKVVLDGYLVVDHAGRIFKSNPEAAAMMGVSQKQLLKLDSFNDAIKITLMGNSLSIEDILKNEIPYRADQLEGVASNGSKVVLTLSYFPFLDAGVVIGAFILLRNMTGEMQRDKNYVNKSLNSITDPLTTLFNRRHLEEELAREEINLARMPLDSDHRNMTIIMCDIDHFKKVNDKYGHPAGDYVIKKVSEIFKESFRKTDVIFRYGGEEFIIMLPASESIGTAIAANKARVAIEKYKFEFEGVTIPIQISMGVAQIMVGQEAAAVTIARADAALYFSKHNGRNQVSIHDGKEIVSFMAKTAA